MEAHQSDRGSNPSRRGEAARLPRISDSDRVMAMAAEALEDLASFYQGEALDAFLKTAEISRRALLRGVEVAESLRDVLSRSLGFHVEPYVTGSHLSGMFSGAKDSRNLADVHKVHEVDIFIPLPSTIDPHDDDLIARVSQQAVLKGPRKLNTELSTPGIPFRQTLLYGYPTFGGHGSTDVVFEVEINLVPGDAIVGGDPTLYWSKLFSPEERYWMREGRRIGRARADIPYDAPGGVKELKEYQQRIARGRLIAGYANGYILDAPPPSLIPFLGRWREYLEPSMPTFIIPVGDRPECPHWVRSLQDLL